MATKRKDIAGARQEEDPKPKKSGPKRPEPGPKKAPPKKQPKKARTGFERAWKQYSLALDEWRESMAQWQGATQRALEAYREASQKALDSPEDLKALISNLEDVWHKMGPEYMNQQALMVKGILQETDIEPIIKFNEQWDKFLKTSGQESIRAYEEALRRFARILRSGM